MLATKTDRKIESTIVGKKIAMSLDQDSLTHLMKVMTDLYSDPEMAIIREYSTNALDSHIEAGISDPIRIVLPTDMAPFLTIQDFGVGLDLDSITEIYSKYGASTKRNTNDQVGMLGLGCKSALTYTDQFTLIGVKDGVRSQVIVSRDEENAGSMTIVSETETDEPSGVTIKIPIRKENKIEEKVQHLFQFWTPGTVLVNDEEPEFLKGTNITKDIVMMDEWEDSYVVMGGVPYPCSLRHNLRNAALVAFVNIGDVDFTPPREALHYNERTRATVERVNADFEKHIATAAEKDIDSCATMREALMAAIKWRAKLGMRGDRQALRYKGKDIPYKYDAGSVQSLQDVPDIDGVKQPKEMKWLRNRYFIVSSRGTTKVSAHNKHRDIATTWMNSAVIVHNYVNEHGTGLLSFTANHKKKMEIYAREMGFTPEYYICCETLPEGVEWLDQSRVVSYDIIKEIKLPSYSKPKDPNRISGSFEVWQDGQTMSNVTADDIELLHDVHYLIVASDNYAVTGVAAKVLPPGISIVYLPLNRVGKFCRTFPKAQNVYDAIKAEYRKAVAAIPVEVFEARQIRRAFSNFNRVNRLVPLGPFKDPEINRLLAAYETDIDQTSDLAKFSHYGGGTGVEIRPWKNPFDDYSMWDWNVLTTEPDHAKLYLDTLYPKFIKKARVAAAKEEAKLAKAARKAKKKT